LKCAITAISPSCQKGYIMNVINAVDPSVIDPNVDQGIELVGTLSHKSLMPPGLLEEVKARPKGNRDVTVIGAIIGRVRGLSMRSNAYSDEPSLAFLGVFDGMPEHNPDGKLRSNACFLPRLINNTLAAVVQGDNKLPLDKAPKKGQKLDVWGLNEINFAVEIAVVHDDTEVGFSYRVKQYGPDAFLISDPLEAVRPLIPRLALNTKTMPPRLARPSVPDATGKSPAGDGVVAAALHDFDDEPGIEKRKPSATQVHRSISDRAKANRRHGQEPGRKVRA
jgi:hypothetical protein